VTDLLAEADALIASGRADRAVQLLASRIAEGRGGLLARLSLGRAQLAAGTAQDAVATLREAASLAPGIADAALALGEALLATGHLPTAIAELQRALRIDPDCEAARFVLGCAWLEAGEAARARDIFAALGSPQAAAKAAEAEALLAAPRAPAGYVRHLFDQFSADYDSRMLGPLGYQAPRLLRELADLVLPPEARGLRLLDLGCGTGLSGAAFRDLAQGGRLDGVDLSPRMIEAARARGIYDALTVADIEAMLAADGAAYDRAASSSSPSNGMLAPASSSAPNAATATARPICATSRPQQASMSWASSPAPRAAKPASRSKALRWRSLPPNRAFLLCAVPANMLLCAPVGAHF
jgi:predicted TPR repeat methyltransferase